MPAETAHTSRIRRITGRIADAARATIAWTRRHWRIAAVAAALVLFVAGPGYTATQPQFYERFERLGTYYETWVASTHANVPCQRCHVSPGTIAQTGYNFRMVGEIYLSLLPLDREPDTLGGPPNAACNECHIDLRAVSPSGDLLIPHAAHVDILKIDCVECHGAMMVHNADPTTGVAPRMEGCLTCHDGEKAKADCNACHLEKGLPDTHQEADWLVVHSEARDEVDCTPCHGWRDDWCAECHSRRPESHGSAANPSDWRKRHREVIESRRNCESCHEGAFCIECHGEVPLLNFDPALTIAQ